MSPSRAHAILVTLGCETPTFLLVKDALVGNELEYSHVKSLHFGIPIYDELESQSPVSKWRMTRCSKVLQEPKSLSSWAPSVTSWGEWSPNEQRKSSPWFMSSKPIGCRAYLEILDQLLTTFNLETLVLYLTLYHMPSHWALFPLDTLVLGVSLI